MKEKIIEVFKNFEVEGDLFAIEQIKNGHINNSYHLKVLNSVEQNWFLQRINANVFHDIEGLMKNVELVTRHLISKDDPGKEDNMQCLRIIRTRNNKLYFTDKEGYSWRLFNFIENSYVYDVVKNTSFAYEGGKVFGRFVMVMSDLDPSSLIKTIPRFHDINYRWEQFKDVLKIEGNPRALLAAKEIMFAEERYKDLSDFYSQVDRGLLPQRITHNDTKFNNIMFNKEGVATCIIDLDTVMPGTVLFDFGDAIRTATNTASEDECDLTKVNFDLDLYEAYTNGYLKECASALTDIEITNLPEAARYMTFLIGLRFLIDYLAGDVYYNITRPNQNIDRARVQFRMVECIESNMSHMSEIANCYINIMNS